MRPWRRLTQAWRRLTRRLTRAWRERIRAARNHDRALRRPRDPFLAAANETARLGRIADRESITITELEDALGLLARGAPYVVSDILDMVEKNGLEGTRKALRVP